MPSVSAVIPSRNRPTIVLRAVQSVLAQSFADLEVIVVVDGPDPATFSALEQIGDPRVRVLALEQSVGASEARNRGAVAAQGQWVALLDDDDEWLPTKIEKQVAEAQQSSARLVFSVCSFLLKTTESEAVAPRRLPRPGEPISEYLFGAPRLGFQTSGFFCSRELMLEKPWKRMKGLQDIDWFLRATADPEVELQVIAEPLCIYWTESVATITSKLDWETCFTWGNANRDLLTRRAYSSFIAKVCAPRAASQGANAAARLRLLRAMLLHGSPSVSALLMFAAYSLLSYPQRRSLANRLFRIKQRLRPAGVKRSAPSSISAA